MSKRLQVLLAPKEYKSFQQIAKGVGLSLGEWVRQALRRAVEKKPHRTPEEMLANIRKAAQYNISPSPPIEQMLKEINDAKFNAIEKGIQNLP